MNGKFTVSTLSEKYMRDNKIKSVVTNRLYSFLNQWSWREMFKDVIDPEEKDQRKTDAIAMSVTSIKPDLEEEIRVVEKIENRLKICCIYHYGRKSGEDTNNNSPKRKDAFDVLMKRNLTKFPCEITEEVGSKFTGKFAGLIFLNYLSLRRSMFL